MEGSWNLTINYAKVEIKVREMEQRRPIVLRPREDRHANRNNNDDQSYFF